MLTLLVPAHLADLLDDRAADPIRTIVLPAGSWRDFLAELRSRHPRFAERVLTAEGQVAAGFVLVVNDTVCAGNPPAAFRAGDEIGIIAAIAGG
jgi:hypothetical protein